MSKWLKDILLNNQVPPHLIIKLHKGTWYDIRYSLSMVFVLPHLVARPQARRPDVCWHGLF